MAGQGRRRRGRAHIGDHRPGGPRRRRRHPSRHRPGREHHVDAHAVRGSRAQPLPGPHDSLDHRRLHVRRRGMVGSGWVVARVRARQAPRRPGHPAGARGGRRGARARRRGGPPVGRRRPAPVRRDRVAERRPPRSGGAPGRGDEPQGCRPPPPRAAAGVGDAIGRLPAARRSRARPRQRVVRDVPALGGRDVRRDDEGLAVGNPRDGGEAPPRDRAHGLRHRLPHPGPPHRHILPQGAEQFPRRPARGPGQPLRDWLRRGRARRHPPGARDDGGFRRVRGQGEQGRVSSWASTSPSSARPTTRGSRSTRSGSGSGPTAPSRTRRIRRRSTRTSTP